ncbi:Protein kinase-like domain,Serine-threonine/tyrosine-protein kinase, catalytic domain [Cinara cedri]|uniref:Protein kinase-like domain,Serine-threonine/tyrosine-protein kinase, catalytic domain n=1 Tax=Cinara cedri TaxID=506608 RepID=A0A5E4MDN8_9HEMI|nr:Protein kinase-like domain,Serine-threonine/tyrosine-protein kinase, catalytic domain [Cinara cedri]
MGSYPQSSRTVSVNGHSLISEDQVNGYIHCGWIVEEYILAVYSVNKLCVVCPKHGDLSLAQVAPDTVFLNLGKELVINDEDIIGGKLLGCGAFREHKQNGILQYTCKSYCSARQELKIMLKLKHQNNVPLISVCTKPLPLIFDLAPMGRLDQILRNYRRSDEKSNKYLGFDHEKDKYFNTRKSTIVGYFQLKFLLPNPEDEIIPII